MNLPPWVLESIYKFAAPETGQVVITLELYKNGVTKLELGGVVRVKPNSGQVEIKANEQNGRL